MERDKLKSRLNVAYRSNERIKAKLSKIEELRKTATRITAVYGDGGGEGTTSPERATIILDTMIKKLQQDIEKLAGEQQEVDRLISMLDDKRLKEIMEARYCNFRTWEQIAADAGYSWTHIHRLHSRALDELDRILKKME